MHYAAVATRNEKRGLTGKRIVSFRSWRSLAWDLSEDTILDWDRRSHYCCNWSRRSENAVIILLSCCGVLWG